MAEVLRGHLGGCVLRSVGAGVGGSHGVPALLSMPFSIFPTPLFTVRLLAGSYPRPYWTSLAGHFKAVVADTQRLLLTYSPLN